MTKRTKILFLGLFVIIIAGLVIWLITTQVNEKISQTQTEQEVIKIGAILSLTEGGATYGNWAKNGMELAIEEINNSSKYKYKYKVIFEDSHSKAVNAVTAFKKLIDYDKVPVVMGFILSDEALACAQTANSTKTVLFSVSAGNDKIKEAGEYVFRNRERGSLQSEQLAKFTINTLKNSKVAIFYPQSAAGINYKNAFEKTFIDLGGEIIFKEGYQEGEIDFKSEIEKLKSIDAKVVLLTGRDPEIAFILRQSYEIGYKPQFIGTVGVESPQLIEIAGNAAEGVFYASSAFDPESKNKEAINFIRKYEEKYGNKPEFIAANAYDAVKIISNSIEKYGYNEKGIRRGIYETKEYQGAGGVTTFDEYGEVEKPIIIKTIRKGKFVKYE